MKIFIKSFVLVIAAIFCASCGKSSSSEESLLKGAWHWEDNEYGSSTNIDLVFDSEDFTLCMTVMEDNRWVASFRVTGKYSVTDDYINYDVNRNGINVTLAAGYGGESEKREIIADIISNYSHPEKIVSISNSNLVLDGWGAPKNYKRQ